MVFFTECFNFFFSLRRVSKIAKLQLVLSDLLLPSLSALAATQATPLLWRILGFPLQATALSLVAHFVLAGAFYAGLLFSLGCVTRQDLRWARRLWA